MVELCVRCKQKPVHIKKRSLCSNCYQLERRKTPQGRYLVRHQGEVDFVRNYFNHKNWIYQPAIFRLSDSSYTPDFYDIATGFFIEVVGTRQAYEANKEKYIEFVESFPSIKFEIRRVNGELIDINQKRQDWPK